MLPRVAGFVMLSGTGVGVIAAEGTASPEVRRWEAGPVPGVRYAELPLPISVAAPRRAGFTSVPAGATGIHFTNLLSLERGLTNQIFMSGSGVACGDFDGDGGCDVYLCGLDSPNRLYRNLGGWKFEDVTDRAGVTCPEGASTGALFADVDGDGDLDLLVSGIGRGVRLFRNDGAGRFRDGTDAAGLRSQSAAMTMAMADIDGDGDLDLYVANYRTGTFQDEPAVRFRISITNGVRRIVAIEGRAPTRAELIRYSVGPGGNTITENGEADALYRNDGRGQFSPVSWMDGTFLDEDGQPLLAPPLDWGYTAMFRDMNGDGSPDLYVCNDNESPDRCWINDGAGRFRALSATALRQTSLSSMGIDFADVNRDGLDDFVVADMLGFDHDVRHRQMIDRRPPHPVGSIGNRPAYQRNTLFLSRGDGSYAEIAQLAGVDATDWTWAPVFLDVDLDGYEDLLVTTGLERSLRDSDARRALDREKTQRRLSAREFQDLRRTMPRLDTPNRAFRNRGDLTFEEMSAPWGFDSMLNSQGMALADLDNDGDLDVVINVLNGPALVYRNGSTAPRITVRLRGRAPNTRGIGARLRISGGPVAQSQEMIAGGRYLSGDESLRTFAAGFITNRLAIEVTWPNGGRSVVSDVRPNRIYEVDEGGAGSMRAPTTVPPPPPRETPWFADVSARLNHRHHETLFNEFERQALLPRRFSQAGPGVSWADLNLDGHDDLIIGAGRGGSLGVYFNDGQGGFRAVDVSGALGALTGDTAAIIARPMSDDASAPGSTAVVVAVAVANYESGSTNAPSVLQIRIGPAGVEAQPSQPGDISSVGPMAVADVDGDGALELFVGGAIVPGRYPEAASSRLLRAGPNGFALDEATRPMLARIGMVNGATFSDLDADGFPELLLACDWGALRILRNRRGRLEPWEPPVHRVGKEPMPLSQLTGWWNSVVTGDFDGDGRLDVVAGNWGRNTKYQRYLEQPLRVYFGDTRGDGGVECIEAHFDFKTQRYVPWRQWDTLAMVMPALLERLPSATAYSQASLDHVLGPLKATLRQWTAVTLESTLFLNRGDHFEAAPLPLEAQFSPVYGLAVSDFDGDGREDLFVAQNFFGVDPETSRQDAGRGLLLRGDGHGQFDPMPASRSGLEILGEQRGAAVADFDGDGRMDLAVAQNGADTRLFRNERATPGVRVRLDAGPGNRTGIGAVLRVLESDGGGAAREVRAGSGYWSQDSAVLVLPGRAVQRSVRVTWPGGRTTTNTIPESAGEVRLGTNGGVRSVR